MNILFLHPPTPADVFQRQLPIDNKIENIKYYIADKITEHEKYDYVVVYGDFPDNTNIRIPKNKLIFVATEPKNVIKYRKKFLSQFALIITADKDLKHARKYITHPALPWHLDCYDDDGKNNKNPMDIRAIQDWFPKKDKLISIVTSDKTFTKEHLARYKFVQIIKEELGDIVDIYGRGIKPISDKKYALANYKYHIALENCTQKNYWTEKIADPFLALCYPIYHGSENIESFFPERSFTKIDIYKPIEAIAIIKQIINEDTFDKSYQNLIAARDKILFEHNIFNLLNRIIHESYTYLTTNKNNKIISVNSLRYFNNICFRQRIKILIKKLISVIDYGNKK